MRFYYLSIALAVWLALLGGTAASAEPSAQFRVAEALAERGKPWRAFARGLESYPLWPYLEYAEFARAPGSTDAEAVRKWLARYAQELPVAPMLRSKLLSEYARTGRWSEYRAIYSPKAANAAERCTVWRARVALAPNAKRALRHAERLYKDSASPQAQCAQAFALLRERGALGVKRVQKRFDALVALNRLSDAEAVLLDLAAPAQTWARARLLAERDPGKLLLSAKNWPDSAAARKLLVRALERTAAGNPATASALLAESAKRFNYQPAQFAAVRREIARASAIDYLPHANGLLSALPAEVFDQPLHEWGVRLALKTQQPELALQRLAAMPAEVANTSRWRFNRARVLDWLGRPVEARALYALAAKEANFHGFLAADRVESGYALCPEPSGLNAQLAAPVLRANALKRIVAFKSMHRLVQAKREWMFLLQKLDPSARRQAGLLAAQEGWGEFAVLALNGPADRRVYEARFPLLHAATLNRSAKQHALDPAFVAGLIRQESAWNPLAVSHANAIGLMQMLPGTAAITARQLGWKGRSLVLTDPQLNLQLGTAHLGLLTAKYAGSPILTTAAYNAGAGAVKRWRDTLYASHPDLWIETIPYHETRDYVAAVLAFSVIYDWRLNGKLKRLSNRIPELTRIDVPVTQVCSEG